MEYIAFLITVGLLHFAALLSPGPNTLLLFQIAAGSSSRTALFAVYGITLVEGAWALLAALGINAFFEAFPTVQSFMGTAGGLYLIYLGVKLWFPHEEPTSEVGKMRFTSSGAFRIGLLTNITNPKTFMFFVSVYATAFTPGLPDAAKYTAVAMITLNAFLWHAMLAFLFSRHMLQRAYTGGSHIIDRVSGALFVFFGCVLIVSG